MLGIVTKEEAKKAGCTNYGFYCGILPIYIGQWVNREPVIKMRWEPLWIFFHLISFVEWMVQGPDGGYNFRIDGRIG